MIRFPANVDPVPIYRYLWPSSSIYSKQREMLRSVWRNDWTMAPAGNEMGKDYMAGRIVPMAFITRSPCRIVTSSATADHLGVLWGEIGEAIQQCRFKLGSEGGPLAINHQFIRKFQEGKGNHGKVNLHDLCPKSYVKSIVAGPDTLAAMQGHHASRQGTWRTLFVGDEASAIPETHLVMVDSWAHRGLLIGNTWACENRFRWALKGRPGTDDKGGDRYSADGQRCYRKVIRIRAQDSPNVQLAERQAAEGIVPTGEIVLNGPKSWDEYLKNRSEWSPAEQCVKLDADFYEGREERMFPAEWLTRAEEVARELDLAGMKRPTLRAIGVDPAEGGDRTAMVCVDAWGVLDLVSRKTPNTADITREAYEFARKWQVQPERIVFDRGGGGKQHADRLAADGFPVRSVGFGESVAVPMIRGKTQFKFKKDVLEQRYEYVNRRAQLYGELMEQLDPSLNPRGFGIPAQFSELRRQIGPLPKVWEKEGRLRMIGKTAPAKEGEATMKDLIGCSPDEADALVLALHALLHRGRVATVGAI